MKRAKPRLVSSETWLPYDQRWGWCFLVIYRVGIDKRRSGHGYTRRSDAKRGAARAWARIQRGAK